MEEKLDYEILIDNVRDAIIDWNDPFGPEYEVWYGWFELRQNFENIKYNFVLSNLCLPWDED